MMIIMVCSIADLRVTVPPCVVHCSITEFFCFLDKLCVMDGKEVSQFVFSAVANTTTSRTCGQAAAIRGNGDDVAYGGSARPTA